MWRGGRGTTLLVLRSPHARNAGGDDTELLLPALSDYPDQALRIRLTLAAKPPGNCRHKAALRIYDGLKH